MKLLYTDTQGFNNIINKKVSFPIYNFLNEGNKIIVISNYVHISDSSMFLSKLDAPGNNYLYNNDSIIYLKLGSVFQFFGSSASRASGGYIDNFSVGYNMEDLIYAPLYYYASKYGEVNSVTFYRSNYYSSMMEQKYDFNKMYDTITKLGGINIFENEGNDIYFTSSDIKFQCKNQKISKQKKESNVLLVKTGSTLIKPFEERKSAFKKYLKQYLEQGNFLAMIEKEKITYGTPLAQKYILDYDTQLHVKTYDKMLEYFNSLDINPEQVSSFTVNRAGIKINGESFNFGFGYNSLNHCINLYMENINKLGYKINNIYTYGINSYHIMPDKDESFSDFLKNKVLEKKLVK